MYELYENLKQQKNCLSYLGAFNDEITDKLVRLSESYLGGVNELSKIRHRVSYLIVECFQNVMRHGEVKSNRRIVISDHRDFFQSSVFPDRVVLASSNLIENHHKEDLELKIQQVNSMGGEELKQLYHDILTNQILSDKGGAGLGLIEMARKSGLPIKKHFNLLTSNYSQFFIGLEIANNKEQTSSNVDLNEIERFYKKLIQQNVLLLYKGDLSRESVSYLIEMLQNNFGHDDEISSQNAKNIITLIEVMQNVSKHGKLINGSKDGIFTISESGGSLMIECGNFVEKHKYPEFRANIEAIKNSSIDEITTLYKKRLLHPEITRSGNCGLGLLEIARNSQRNFTFKFVETPDKEIFFSLKVKSDL